jgi:hypothetical protein
MRRPSAFYVSRALFGGAGAHTQPRCGEAAVARLRTFSYRPQLHYMRGPAGNAWKGTMLQRRP